jgi:class 3 adenylate cyclase/tetratricopeptide (TPR) repeat protein
MQRAMRGFTQRRTSSGRVIALAMKASVAAGAVRRMSVGDPNIRLMDTLAGATLARMALGEHHANRGEVVVSADVAAQLGEMLTVIEWREDEETHERFAVVTNLQSAESLHVATIMPESLGANVIRPWLLQPVHERLQSGHSELLAELRPTLAMFLRFGGLDYDVDAAAPQKLDAYVRWVQGVVAHYEGAVCNLTIGDKGSYFFISFGAPIAHEDDAERALHAALALRETPSEFAWLPPPQIGVTRGTMWTGAYGGLSHRTYSAFSDEVNLAARLMQAAQPGQILVNQSAQRAAQRQFMWENVGELKLKGKSEPIVAYELNGVRAQRDTHESEDALLPLVGRETELHVARENIEHALQGRGHILGVVAEAGMGKSRFVAEVARLAQARGFACYASACLSYGVNSSYLVWQSLLRSVLGLREQSPDGIIQQLTQQLAAIDASLAQRLPLLSAVLAVPIPDNDLTRSMDAKLRKASLEALVVDYLHQSVRQPLMLVLEDCQWIDALSRDLLELISRALADRPLLIVVAYRPERTPLPLDNFSELRLRALDAIETMQLVERKLTQLDGRQGAVSEALIERINERAQGNPFYIAEWINLIHERGVDLRKLKGGGTNLLLDLPDSLHGLVLSRLDQLEERLKSSLKLASVAGRLFKASWLWGAYPHIGTAEQVQAYLLELTRLELTQQQKPEPEWEYLFKSAVTHDATYESLSAATRATLHEQIAAFIESAHAQELSRWFDVLAYHYSRTRNLDKQRDYLRKAGEAAQAAYANDAAIQYYRRLLELHTRHTEAGLPITEYIHVSLKLGEVLELVGRWDEAYELYQRASSAALAQPTTAQLQSLISNLYLAMGSLWRKRAQYTEALAWLKRARVAAENLGQRETLSQVLVELGEVYRAQGDYVTARTLYDESLTTQRALHGRHGEAMSLFSLGNVAWYQGDYAAARALREDALAIFRDLGHRPSIAMVLDSLSIVALEQGDYTQAHTLLEESLQVRRALGDKAGVSASLNNLGRMAQRQGDNETARAFYAESLTLKRELGDQRGIAVSLNNLGMILSEQGDYHGARALYEQSLALFRQLGHKRGIVNLLNNLALASQHQHDYERARALYTESLTRSRELDDKLSIAEGLAGMVGVKVAMQQAVQAAQLAGAAQALLKTIGAELDHDAHNVFQQNTATTRTLLDAATFEMAYAEGQALGIEQAVAVATG